MMTDRERMIEVIDKYANDRESEELFDLSRGIADRLIEAGFGRVEKEIRISEERMKELVDQADKAFPGRPQIAVAFLTQLIQKELP